MLQVVPSLASETGGPARSTVAACVAWSNAAAGRVTLLSTDEGLDEGWRQKLLEMLGDRVQLKTFSFVGSGPAKISIPMLRWLRRSVKDYDLVVVRSLYNPIASLAATLARANKVPYVLVPHGMLSTYTAGSGRVRLKRWYYQLIDRRTVNGAAAIQFTAEAELRAAPPHDSRSVVIPHPLSLSSTPAKVADSQTVLFMGRFAPKKGLDVLIEAFSHVTAEFECARLVVAGGGSDDETRKAVSQVAELGLEDRVRFPGFVTGQAKEQLFSAAAMFALPSRHENFGVAVVEAASAGVPSLVSREVDIAPTIEKAGAGLIVERDVIGLARAISNLLRDPERRTQMGRAARTMVRDHFDPDAVGARLAACYRDAAASAER